MRPPRPRCSGSVVLSALASAALFLSSCSTSSVDSSPEPDNTIRDGNLLISALARDSAPAVEAAQIAELVDGNNAFAWDLYRKLGRQFAGNLFFSPYSVSQALAMAYAGARGGTAAEMETVLHFSLGQTSLHPAFNALDLQLRSRGQGAQGREGEGFALRIADAMWGEQTYPFLQSFLDVLAVNYGAGMRLVDFMGQPEECRVIINDWVYNETNQKIEDLIPPGDITPITRLVIVNAVYFDAAWADTFDHAGTFYRTYHLSDADTIQTMFMHTFAQLSYAEDSTCQAVELPYDGNEISMVLVLPKQGNLEAFEQTLTAVKVGGIIAVLTPQLVRLGMPRYNFTFGTASLVAALNAMGMAEAFNEGLADFSGIVGRRGPFISDVEHQAFVAVDEKGTTASAATVVRISESAHIPDVTITLDRPFVFFIRDIPTGQVLFAGRVANPKPS